MIEKALWKWNGKKLYCMISEPCIRRASRRVPSVKDKQNVNVGY